MRSGARTAVIAVAAASLALVGFEAILVPTTFDLLSLLVPLSFLAVGTLVGYRQPSNIEAWLLLVTGSAWAVAFSVPFDGSWVVPLSLMTTHLLLRFPDGRLPSRRWTAFSWFCVVMPVALAVVVSTSSKTTIEDLPNPYYLSWSRALVPLLALLPLAMVVSAGSLVVRYRRAGWVQRRQVRWIVFTVAVVVAWYVTTLAVSLLYDQRVGRNSTQSSWFGTGYPAWLLLLELSALLSFVLIPTSFGLAILRYRLYDLDRIISRTTSYLVVTGLVSGTYALVVAFASRLLPGSSSLTVALATLAAAAVFRPALRRVRSAVDRRFDRTHFDALSTAEDFATQLQQMVDVDVVSAQLLRTVTSTLQPTGVSLWLSGLSTQPAHDARST